MASMTPTPSSFMYSSKGCCALAARRISRARVTGRHPAISAIPTAAAIAETVISAERRESEKPKSAPAAANAPPYIHAQ